MKTTENKGFLTSPNAMGRSVAVKLPVAFQKANKINGFEHIFYGTALFQFLNELSSRHTSSMPRDFTGIGIRAFTTTIFV